MNLHSLNEIFIQRLFRIPDYQRGYAWLEHQLDDFWEDLLQLDDNRVHYTGVITLEPVSQKIWSRWDNDEWLIEGVGFKPFYVVELEWFLLWKCFVTNDLTDKNLSNNKKKISINKNIGIFLI